MGCRNLKTLKENLTMKSRMKLWHLAASAVFTVAGGTMASAQSCHDVRLDPLQLREQEARVQLRRRTRMASGRRLLFDLRLL